MKWPLPTAIACAALLALATLGGILYCRALGYPDGPMFKLVPAERIARAPMRGTVAVYVSGDMGFNAGMGPRIAARIARQGIPVVGVNSLAAFSQRRNPAEVTAIIAQAMRQALALPGARRVVLIGHSFGANMLIAGARSLPAALRNRIALVELLVPGETMSFRATPAGIFDGASEGAALEVARGLDWLPVLCVHGRIEQGSLCPIWHQANVTQVTLPGDHFLHQDTALVAATLVRDIAATTDRAAPGTLPKFQVAQSSAQHGGQ